jgi:hypothetical protein
VVLVFLKGGGLESRHTTLMISLKREIRLSSFCPLHQEGARLFYTPLFEGTPGACETRAVLKLLSGQAPSWQ